MTKQNLGIRVSLVGKLTVLVGVAVVALAVLFAGSMALGSSTAYAGVPTETPTAGPTVEPTPMPPTSTPVPDATIFVGTVEVVDETCGGGTFSLTLNPEGTGITAVDVVDFVVSGTASTQNLTFDPPIAVAADGSFSNSAPLPPPLEVINGGLVGTFDFSADPATVAGTLTISLVADPSTVLCEADFTAEALAAGAPIPTVAAVPTALPVTGTSAAPGTGGDGVLWATVAGIVALFALGAAGAVAVRRRSA